MLLGTLIEYFESADAKGPTAVYKAYSYTAGICLCTVWMAVLHHLYFYHVQRAGMKIRVAMCHMIYRKVRMDEHDSFFLATSFNTCFFSSAKSLSLNNTALTKTTTGQIVNLLSNDVNTFDEVIV